MAFTTDAPAAYPAATAWLPTEGSRPQKPTRAPVVDEPIIWSRAHLRPKTEECVPGLGF
jgi:hypothetical protein